MGLGLGNVVTENTFGSTGEYPLMGDSPTTGLRENATGIASLVVTGVWLALLFLPGTGDLWLATLLFGYIVVVPVVSMLFGDEDDDSGWETETHSQSSTADDRNTESDQTDALETLRNRYAAGKLTDDQFERKLERLLETETLEDVEARPEQTRQARDRDLTRDPEFER